MLYEIKFLFILSVERFIRVFYKYALNITYFAPKLTRVTITYRKARSPFIFANARLIQPSVS